LAVEKGRAHQLLVEVCPECGSANLVRDYNVGETVCGSCGLVVSDLMLDLGPEWRAYTQEEETSKRRAGSPTSYCVVDKGLSTIISRFNRDASGKKLPFSTKLQMRRLRKHQFQARVRTTSEKNLSKATVTLDMLAEKLKVPKTVKEEAALLYRKALNTGLTRGRPIKAMAAAAFYIACRRTGTPRTLIEVARKSLAEKGKVARCYRLLVRKLGLQTPLADPLIYISKIAEKAGVPAETQGIAVKILLEAKRKKATLGRSPRGLAATCLYIACQRNGGNVTQRELSQAASISEVTIRNCYKNLVKAMVDTSQPDNARLNSQLHSNV